MHINKKILLLLILPAFIFVNTAAAQRLIKKNGKPFRSYAFVLYAGGGIAQYAANLNTIPVGLEPKINKNSAYETIRLMWHPNYRLRVGLETGYTNFYSYTVKNGNHEGKVKLTAVPLLLVWSIKIVKRVNLFAGFGSYFLTTHLNYNGNVKSGMVSLGSNIAVNYLQPVSNKVQIALEGKWLNAFQTKDNMLALQLQVVWRFLDY